MYSCCLITREDPTLSGRRNPITAMTSHEVQRMLKETSVQHIEEKENSSPWNHYAAERHLLRTPPCCYDNEERMAIVRSSTARCSLAAFFERDHLGDHLSDISMIRSTSTSSQVDRPGARRTPTTKRKPSSSGWLALSYCLVCHTIQSLMNWFR